MEMHYFQNDVDDERSQGVDNILLNDISAPDLLADLNRTRSPPPPETTNP